MGVAGFNNLRMRACGEQRAIVPNRSYLIGINLLKPSLSFATLLPGINQQS